MRNKILILVLMTATFIGCSEDFLEKEPLDKISASAFQPRQALVGVYDALQFWYNAESNPYYDALSPIGHNRTSGQGFRDIGQGSFSATSSAPRYLWEDAYAGIFRANDFLEKLEDFDMDEAEKTLYKAEARFVRAYLHHRLVSVFGNIVYLDYVPEIEEGRSMTQSPASVVIPKILEDLDFAVSNLPVIQEEVGRITQGAALAFKARVYLWENDFPNVKVATDAIFDLNVYDLTDTYLGVFDWQDENNSEVIFDVQFIGPGLGEGGTIEHLLGTKDRDRNGWFHVSPTKFMVDMYETVDGSPVDPMNEYDNRDPRFYATMFVPGDTLYGVPFIGSNTWNKLKTKFACKKFIMTNDDGSETNAAYFDAPTNYIVIRYADVLLMAAEAENEINGPTNDTYAFINEIRTRAGMPDLPVGLTQEEMRAAIHKERIIELAFEGLTYEDMKRWMTPEEIKVYVESNPPRNYLGEIVETRVFDISKHMLWPIPQRELDNVPTLVQNPGW